MLITSLDNKKVKEWKKLLERKYRDELGLFMVEGLHLVEEAFKKGYLEELILLDGTSNHLDKEPTYVTLEIMKYITSLDTPSNTIGICKKVDIETNLGNKILLIDSIQDPGNLGTIIRSAVAFKIDTIVLGSNTVDVYNPKCIRGTQGMLFNLNIIEKDLLTFIPILKRDEYHILGTNVNHGRDLKTFKPYSKYALIVGNEGAGMQDNLLNLCDDLIYIKMNKDCESLNVSIACSIILYQLSE
jgi:TrmH family RNA methyltransferase